MRKKPMKQKKKQKRPCYEALDQPIYIPAVDVSSFRIVVGHKIDPRFLMPSPRLPDDRPFFGKRHKITCLQATPKPHSGTCILVGTRWERIGWPTRDTAGVFGRITCNSLTSQFTAPSHPTPNPAFWPTNSGRCLPGLSL